MITNITTHELAVAAVEIEEHQSADEALIHVELIPAPKDPEVSCPNKAHFQLSTRIQQHAQSCTPLIS